MTEMDADRESQCLRLGRNKSYVVHAGVPGSAHLVHGILRQIVELAVGYLLLQMSFCGARANDS